ncbi:hypothetical protein [Planctomyces sp. SH-PL62]|uniref:hypothetical protein n=1 Tax=Planctomyces sp. SH-PL62 TaxID=1636152 RepID=UPI00078D125E|nr:hypothetical protein [Planctomyces sp. SH-PL62]AMV37316.1 hypothetical protein VT85_07775 [Planctomyces sp. SH-PL62]
MSRGAHLLKTLALAAATAGLTIAPAAADEPGTIKGRVVWAGSTVPTPKVLVEKGKATKDLEVCGVDGPIVSQELQIDPETKGVAGALVYLVKPTGSNPAAVEALMKAHPKAVLDQKNCEFIPYIQGIYKDQPLVIKSSDPVNHNVRYNGFSNASMNQMLGVGGSMEVKLEAERRPLMVACDIHPWMKAYIAVFDHPYFAVTGEDGSFELKGVPAGAQNLVVWQEKAGWINEGKAKGAPVTVKAGAATDVGEIKLQPNQVK